MPAAGGGLHHLLNSDAAPASVTFAATRGCDGKSLLPPALPIIVAPNNGITGSLTISLTSNATTHISFGTPVTPPSAILADRLQL